MKVLCYGSINIDLTYSVEHIVKEGETLSSLSLKKSAGGKGANQCAALAKAGLKTFHAGKIGEDGVFILKKLESFGVDTSNVSITNKQTGHAIIQVDKNAQNSIILFPGENKAIEKVEIDSVLSNFASGDWIVLQNEINELKYIIDKAYDKDINICFNPAPFDRSILDLPLEKVSLLVVNEIEGAALAGIDSSFEEVLKTIKQRYPKCNILLTLGSDGSLYYGNNEVVSQNCFKVKAVDTTAAGDTFIGYFLASITDGFDIKDALEIASAASAITVSRNGAMDSIPYKEEVVKFLKDRK